MPESSGALELAKELIARRSITPEDGGCQEMLVARLAVAERILNLQTQVKQLSGLLPICAVCKKVRDDPNYWPQVESYIAKRTEARFSHGYCPECFNKTISELKARTDAGSAVT